MVPLPYTVHPNSPAIGQACKKLTQTDCILSDSHLAGKGDPTALQNPLKGTCQSLGILPLLLAQPLRCPWLTDILVTWVSLVHYNDIRKLVVFSPSPGRVLLLPLHWHQHTLIFPLLFSLSASHHTALWKGTNEFKPTELQVMNQEEDGED